MLKVESDSTLGLFSFRDANLKIGIVQSKYHDAITNKLLTGAQRVLKMYGVGSIFLLEMPGAYELVYGTQKLVHQVKDIHGIITLGCVIKGDTEHDVYINHAVAQGLMRLESKFNLPIGFGLLTTNNEEQALARSGGTHGNKGEEVALAVLQCIAAEGKSI